MKAKISNRYAYEDKPKVSCEGSVSVTKQSAKNESDINKIMEKANRTGVIGNPLFANRNRVAQFGDFSNITDFQGLQNKIIEVNETFLKLPSSIRKRFNHNPSTMLDFVMDESNLKECIELGLISKYEDPKEKEKGIITGKIDTEGNPIPKESEK